MNPNRIRTKIRWIQDDVVVHEVLLGEVPRWGTSGGHLINGRKRWTSQWVPLFSSWLYGCINRYWKTERDFKFCCTIWYQSLHWHWNSNVMQAPNINQTKLHSNVSCMTCKSTHQFQWLSTMGFMLRMRYENTRNMKSTFAHPWKSLSASLMTIMPE